MRRTGIKFYLHLGFISYYPPRFLTGSPTVTAFSELTTAKCQRANYRDAFICPHVFAKVSYISTANADGIISKSSISTTSRVGL